MSDSITLKNQDVIDAVNEALQMWVSPTNKKTLEQLILTTMRDKGQNHD